jgi:hypothetical protein
MQAENVSKAAGGRSFERNTLTVPDSSPLRSSREKMRVAVVQIATFIFRLAQVILGYLWFMANLERHHTRLRCSTRQLLKATMGDCCGVLVVIANNRVWVYFY